MHSTNIPNKHPGSRGSKLPIYLVTLLVIAGIMVLSPGAIDQQINKSSQHFAVLVQQNKYSEAQAYYEKVNRYLPGNLQEKTANQARQELESQLDLITTAYLAHKMDLQTVNSSVDSIDKMGLHPENLDKCRTYIKIEELAEKTQPEQAIAAVEEALRTYPDDPILTAKLADLKARIPLVPYHGPIQHIFFHPLIAYPELAFDNDGKSKGLNEYMVTVSEFNKILDSLYEKGFILIDINTIFEERSENGQEILAPRQLMLPEGKKPLILSIDDMNYYPYMIENGMVHKLVLDSEGNVATYTRTSSGITIAHDNEIIPIVDEFVKKHPDFSYQGAKGVIALTGFDGVLGYRTNQINSPNYAEEKQNALAIINRLKETGWSFASHGYGHLNTRAVTLTKLETDTMRWKSEVESLVGPTKIYIFPFGARVLPGDPKFQYLQTAGFKVFCAVGPREYMRYGRDYIVQDRRHMDGIALLTQPATLVDLFDSQQVVDPIRPPIPKS